MSQLKVLRDYIETQISSVSPDIGPVYPRHIYVTTEQGFKALCKHRDTLRVWMFTREATPATPGAGNLYEREHKVVIRGYYAVQDDRDSELDIQDHAELIVEALEADAYLGGKVKLVTPVTVQDITHVRFGGVLCHRAHLVLTAKEWRSRVGTTA